ncbi:hypothetical protein FCV25MIE_27270, partial [Fagus crenata]
MYWNDYNSLSLEGQHIPINAAEVQAIEQLLLRIGEYFEKGSTSGTTKGEGSPPKEDELLSS